MPINSDNPPPAVTAAFEELVRALLRYMGNVSSMPSLAVARGLFQLLRSVSGRVLRWIRNNVQAVDACFGNPATRSAAVLSVLVMALEALRMDFMTDPHHVPLAHVVLGLHNVFLTMGTVDNLVIRHGGNLAATLDNLVMNPALLLAWRFPVSNAGFYLDGAAVVLAGANGFVQRCFGTGRRPSLMTRDTQILHLVCNRVLLSWVHGRIVGGVGVSAALLFHFAPRMFGSARDVNRSLLGRAAESRRNGQPSSAVPVPTRNAGTETEGRARGQPRQRRARVPRPRCHACRRGLNRRSP